MHKHSNRTVRCYTVQVVFNCIDYGEYFDYAVMSLCTSLSLPYITASSYGHTAIAECYPALDIPQKGDDKLHQL